VGDGIDATTDGDTELAVGEEVSSEVVAEMGHDDCAREAAPGSADADWPEL
jgi:hypothetical protein